MRTATPGNLPELLPEAVRYQGRTPRTVPTTPRTASIGYGPFLLPGLTFIPRASLAVVSAARWSRSRRRLVALMRWISSSSASIFSWSRVCFDCTSGRRSLSSARPTESLFISAIAKSSASACTRCQSANPAAPRVRGGRRDRVGSNEGQGSVACGHGRFPVRRWPEFLHGKFPNDILTFTFFCLTCAPQRTASHSLVVQSLLEVGRLPLDLKIHDTTHRA